jgi:hypothetical protein
VKEVSRVDAIDMLCIHIGKQNSESVEIVVGSGERNEGEWWRG